MAGVNDDEETTNSGDDENTTVVGGDTYRVRLSQDVAHTPPSIMMLEGPAGYVGKQWPIDKAGMVIGRQMACQIFIDDKSVSRTHARIDIKDGEVFLTDLESSNKTIVNERVLQPNLPHQLEDSATIKAGNVLFKFRARGSLEANAIERLQRQSERDPLTGCLNRAALVLRANELFKRSSALKVPMSVAVFDIDHFKKVNDTYGHPCGDFVLKEMIHIIASKLIRADDILARYGGEEFVVLLFGSMHTQAMDIGERLRTTTEGHPFIFGGVRIPVTISVGVATRGNDTATFDQLFERADQALYASKRSGRNRVTAA